MACESGVRLNPVDSFKAPLPRWFMDVYPVMASTGKESDSATAMPENRLNAPGPPVAKHTPKLPGLNMV